MVLNWWGIWGQQEPHNVTLVALNLQELLPHSLHDQEVAELIEKVLGLSPLPVTLQLSCTPRETAISEQMPCLPLGASKQLGRSH